MFYFTTQRHRANSEHPHGDLGFIHRLSTVTQAGGAEQLEEALVEFK